MRSLSLNRNVIRDLGAFLERVNAAFPNIRSLSLLGNESCPIFGADDAYQAYRRQCAARLPMLKLLDSKPVTAAERGPNHQ